MILPDTPIVERFFLEVVRPALNRRVRSLEMWEAPPAVVRRSGHRYRHLACHVRRLARWHKGRIGGTVWYLDLRAR
jgi:hypothetical protein